MQSTINYLACTCDYILPANMTVNEIVPVTETKNLTFAFESPKCSLESRGCSYNWAFDIQMRNFSQVFDENLFSFDQKSGSFTVKTEKMSHTSEELYAFDLVMFNNKTSEFEQFADNYTVFIDIIEEKK